MDLIRKYHRYWTKLSRRIDELVKDKPLLRKAKKLFDVHFRVLGVLGVFATPRTDLDCYCYMCYRAKETRWAKYSWRRRIQIALALIRRALK